MAWFDYFQAAEMAEFNSGTYFPIDLKELAVLFALAPDEVIRKRASGAISRLITMIANSAHHGVITGAQGRSYEHSLCVADTLELNGLARLLWGKGQFCAHVNCLTQIALRDHRLELPDLADVACWEKRDMAQEWTFWQGENAFCRLYHYKTSETAMGSAALYRWRDWVGISGNASSGAYWSGAGRTDIHQPSRRNRSVRFWEAVFLGRVGKCPAGTAIS
ncbi:hypothetical protein [Thalassospira lucentensis]|uniref:hypothetical protein n=1 Tax=Thalassospira lucentensis TaxID=168935 RepID=UPI003AA96B93